MEELSIHHIPEVSSYKTFHLQGTARQEDPMHIGQIRPLPSAPTSRIRFKTLNRPLKPFLKELEYLLCFEERYIHQWP